MKILSKIDKYSKKQLAIFVFLVGFLIYLPSLGNGFLYDDAAYITNNVFVKEFNLKQIFTSDVGRGAGVVIGRFRPITQITLAWDNLWWQENPMGFHLSNNVFHALSASLLFLVLLKLGLKKSESIFLALIYAIHPSSVETVSFIASRGDSLGNVFIFAGMLSLFEKDRLWRSILLLMLAVMSKESAVVGLALYGLAWWFDGAKKEKLWVFGGIGTALGFYVWYLFRVVGFGTKVGASMLNTVYEGSLLVRMLTLPRIVFEYFRLLLIPADLYMGRVVTIYEGFNWWILLLVVLTIWLIKLGIKEYEESNTSHILMGMFWFGATLAPFCGILYMSNMLYEHWMYLPMVGFFLGLLGVFRLNFKFKKIFIFLLIVWMGWLGFNTITQQRVWRNERIFFSYMYEKSGNPRMAVNLCKIYSNDGDYEEALRYCEDAAEKWKNFHDAYFFKAETLLKLGRVDEAESSYLRALEIRDNSIKAKESLYNIYFSTERYQKALEMSEKMIEQNGSIKLFWLMKANALEKLGDTQGAEIAKIKAMKVDAKEGGGIVIK